MRFPTWLRATLVFLLLLGVAFRFVNLSHKVYWHDEVYTSIRAAGYTRAEFDEALFQNKSIHIGELQKFQQIKPQSTAIDTLRSLAEEPQHPPLYFLIARFWMQAFGSSVTASRILPVLFSLLSLPLMYALAYALFGFHPVALMATTLLALSPIDVLFAQNARQYSLLTALTIASHWLLWRALNCEVKERRSRRLEAQRKWTVWRDWGLYSLSVATGLYVQPFFVLVLIGHAVYVGLEFLFETQRTIFQKPRYANPVRMIQSFGLAIMGGIVLYAPWLYVLFTNYSQVMATTGWTKVFPGVEYLAKIWTFTFTSLFLDFNFGSDLNVVYNNIWLLLLKLSILLLIGVSLYFLCRYCERPVWLFVLTAVLVPFLLLVLPDLIMGAMRSGIIRYLIPSFPGIQLAVAYFLTKKLAIHSVAWRASNAKKKNRRQFLTLPYPFNQWLWNTIFGLLILGSLVSLTTSALAFSWWDKDISYTNNQVASFIKASPSPVIISDIGDDWTNTGNLISLSYLLDKNTKLLLVSADGNWATTQEFQSELQGSTAFAFRPKSTLKAHLDEIYSPLKAVVPEEPRFWQLYGGGR